MNLLIVDDEIFAIQGLLDSVDWKQLHIDKVLTASSCTQAINIFMENQINILLSDIEMPYGTGIELVKWVKSHYPETECIFLTCHDDFSLVKQALTLKCFDYLLKPVKPNILMDVLKSTISQINQKEKDKEYQQYGQLYFQNMFGGEQKEEKNINKILEITENYIHTHISEPLTVEGIAKHVYLSPDYLTRSFKKKYNQTLIDYIMEQRLFLAKELLIKNTMSIQMISAKIGYPNCSYFTKIFKRYYGMTPREYQREHIA